jgi:hypothetical protein
MKTALMIFWVLIGIYFVISALPVGAGWTTFAAMVAGFMVARNMADVVAT